MILIKNWQEAQREAYFVRESVFIQEQGVPAVLELDEFDSQAQHALAYQASKCIGTARLVIPSPKEGRIGRMAVLKAYRGKGFGKLLLQSLIWQAGQQGLTQLTLHAQLTAISFYEQFGFEAVGDPYDEAGIPHRDMILHISTLDHLYDQHFKYPFSLSRLLLRYGCGRLCVSRTLFRDL